MKNSYPAIVSAEVFDLTQIKFRRHKALKGQYSENGCFASRVVCVDCGGFFGSKVWYSNAPYHKVIWRCNQKYEKPSNQGVDTTGADGIGAAEASSDEHNGGIAAGVKCRTPHVTQKALEAAFMKVLNRLLVERDDVIDACRTAIAIVMNTE